MIKKLCNSFLVFVFLIAALTPNQVYADTDVGIGRTRTCSASDGTVEGLEFDPTSGGKDAQFVLDNPVCIYVIASTYAAVKGAIMLMNTYCSNNSSVRITPSPLYDSIDLLRSGVKCTQAGGTGSCCGAFYTAFGIFGTAIAQLAIIWAIAEDVYDNTHVCGAQWMKPNVSKYDFSAADHKQAVQLEIDGYIRDKNTGSTGLNVENQTYREWFYNGVEYEDNPYQGEACRDPTQAKQNGEYPKQKYYLKGTEVGNYNCKKYLLLEGQSNPNNYDFQDMRDAYECCLNRSQNYMCIDYTNINVVNNPPVQLRNTPTFCKKGEKCTMMRPGYYADGIHHTQIQNGGIWFEVQEDATSNGGLLCAKTYSLCPYNFNVGGGSDYCDYYRDGTWSASENRWTIITQEQIDAGECSGNSEIRNADCTYNEKTGKCKNYCQYLVHCAKTSTEGFVYESGLGSPYFSQACKDFVGDSQNNTGFNTGVIMGKQTHFTAPIAQCIKESLENLFYNRAGHSKCLSANESPDANGVCASGSYVTDGTTATGFQFVYKKGNKVKENSFFQTIQNTMSLVIKMAITLAVVFYGINLLLWKTSLGDKKSILVFVFKIALVMYFCVGTAWQDVFFRGFYDSSMVFANMLFKIETMQDETQRDGCQFGKVSLSDGTQEIVSVYPSGKEYLAIWDTIDCKMMRYLGFGPQLTNANIASMVISAYFFGPIGIYFAISVMIFGFFLVSLGIRALHIFISSAAAIILLIFISPLVIPCGMFERTKGIFNGWLGKLISYCLQPMILFAYVAIFVTIMDQTLIGSATFHGLAPTKTLSCDEICVDSNGAVVPYDGNQAPACDQDDQELINPLDDSVACLLNFQDFGQWHAFEVIGVALPIVQNLFEENVKQRILTMLKGALVMGLLYMFMDEIPGITSALVGGGLGQKGPDAFAMAKQAAGVAKMVSERLGRAGAKVGGSVRSGIEDKMRESFSKGKKVGEAEKAPEVDSTERSGGSDNTAKQNSGDDTTGGGGGNDSTEK